MEQDNLNKAVNEGLPSDNAADLYSLIQSIQSKLNKENINDNNISNNDSNNTYKEINDTQKNNSNNNNQQNNNSNQINFANIASLLQNVDLGSILGSFNGKSQNQSDSSSSGFNFGNFDESTINRIQKIISSMNQKDPKRDLLLSLKPFLRKSRQDKIGEYVTMLTVANAIGIFDRKGSDENV